MSTQFPVRIRAVLATALGFGLVVPAGPALAGRAAGGVSPVGHPAAAPRIAGTPPYAELTGVSCPRAGDCLAVGFHTVGGSLPVYPLAEAWHGRAWRLLKAPVIRGRLLGVACPRPAVCIAVGSHDTSDGRQASPLAARWNGRRWRLLRTARVPRNYTVTDLASISCKRPRWCAAVSGYGDAEPTVSAAAETWNGRRWRLRAVFGQSSLNGVACKTRTRCLAVGSASPASDSWAPFAVARKGRDWRPVAVPPGDNGNLDIGLASVSCATATTCMAVGEGMLADQWAGSGWNQLTTPGLGQLDGVSCKIPSACVAVGEDGNLQAAARAWNGAAWRTLAPVRPAGPSLLAGVSCSAPARCMAVGFYGTPYVRRPLAEQWNGSTWLRLRAPAA